MNEKKYLIYLDILGFEALAEKVASEKGIDQRDVREKFIDVIKERVERLEAKGKIIGKKYGESDDWLLVADALDKVFNCILEILDHDTGYRDYEKVPLEIGIGTGEYDKWARFDGTNLIVENDTIKFYKTNIIDYYHKWYKIHNKQSPKSTFIVLTESAYHELEHLDRKICQEIKYKKNNQKGELITFFAADIDKVQQRGRVFEFLEKIGYSGGKLYARIDTVYVSPSEYEDMARTLHERKILFITGTPEYGKTYTAVRLMWEFYNRGYEPRWILGGESAERTDVRRKLEDVRAMLKPGRIIYFEDPFGTTNYEGRGGLESEIGTILDSVRQVGDAYVIITSREEVFKEFKKEKVSTRELREFEKKLNIKKPSYDYEKRKQILLNWAEEEKCKWLANKELKELVLESIKDEKTLPTPLRIKGFAVSTFDIETEDGLKEQIEEKSKETAKAFAKEIKNMTDDKILFLSFLFISDYFRVEFFRTTYQELKGGLNLTEAWEFDRVLNWFKGDKVDCSGNHIKFSHPSYSEALPYLLVEDGYLTRINKEIFSKLLLKISENDAPDMDLATTVADNFNKLPENVRNLLFKFSKMDGTAAVIALSILFKFDELPDDMRNELLLNLSEMDEAAEYVAFAMGEHFDRLPDDVINKLLLNISETGAADEYVADCVAYNYDKLHENVRNLLFKLSEIDEAASDVAGAVTSNFDKIPDYVRNELLLKLSEKDEAAGVVAEFVADNFDKLPNDMKNLLDGLQNPLQQVIEELSGEDEPRVLHLISNTLPKLNIDFALQILNELCESEDEKVRTEAAKLLKTISNDSMGNEEH